MNNRLIEITLLEITLMVGLNLIHTKLAVFIGLLTGILAFALLLISLILEFVEASKISRAYFAIMSITSIVCLSISILTIYIFGWPFSQ